MTTNTHTDIRLVAISSEIHAALTSTDGDQIAKAVLFLIHAYEAAPPMTAPQAIAYSQSIEWWRDETADL